MNKQFLISVLCCNILVILLWHIGWLIASRVQQKDLRETKPDNKNLIFIFILYSVSIAAITIVPLPFSSIHKPLRDSINYEPFFNTASALWENIQSVQGGDIKAAIKTSENVVGNILMFIPLGLMLPMLAKKYRKFWRTVLVGFLASCTIETTQLVSRIIRNYRQVDVDDVLLNTTGAAVGFASYWVFSKVASNKSKRKMAYS